MIFWKLHLFTDMSNPIGSHTRNCHMYNVRKECSLENALVFYSKSVVNSDCDLNPQNKAFPEIIYPIETG